MSESHGTDVTTETKQSARRPWLKPEVRSLEAGSAELGDVSSEDGAGFS